MAHLYFEFNDNNKDPVLEDIINLSSFDFNDKCSKDDFMPYIYEKINISNDANFKVVNLDMDKPYYNNTFSCLSNSNEIIRDQLGNCKVYFECVKNCCFRDVEYIGNMEIVFGSLDDMYFILIGDKYRCSDCCNLRFHSKLYEFDHKDKDSDSYLIKISSNLDELLDAVSEARLVYDYLMKIVVYRKKVSEILEGMVCGDLANVIMSYVGINKFYFMKE
jgi:hypothetical protein